MKIKFLTVLAVLSAMLCCTLFPACGSTCKAEYSDMTVYEYVEPTCTKKGRETYYYCNLCKKYWTTPAHKKETSPEANVLDKLGHNYQAGKCARTGCGKIDPALLPDTLNIPDIEVSDIGMLTWGGIKIASKYRVEITDENGQKHAYDITDSQPCELNLANLEDGLQLAYGKNYASITAYKPYSENIDGETVADDIPVSESKSDFIAIKQNSGYSSTTLNYADDFISINGAYSDVRTDNGEEYILIEQQMSADAQNVKFNLSSKVKAASGCLVSYYKDKNCTKEISSMDWKFWSTPAGATDYYVKVEGVVSKVYTVRVLAVKPVEVNLLKAERTGMCQYYFTKLIDGLTVLENDYIDVNMFYAKVESSSDVVIDADFKMYGGSTDCIMPVCQGKSYNFYVIDDSLLGSVESSVKKYGAMFDSKFVWGENGMPSYWTLSLRSDYTGKGAYVPYYFGEDCVVPTVHTLGYSNNLQRVVFESGHTALASQLFSGCGSMTEVYIPNSAKDNLGDFLFLAALKDTLTVYCEYNIPNGRWNQISGSMKYFNTVQNATIPSFDQINY